MSRAYKDHKIYSCFALNLLVSKLNIYLYHDNLDEKIASVFTSPHRPDR